MLQNQLFIESLSDALDEAISQLGGRKKVANMLWPEKTIQAAGNYLGDCLNAENRNKLSLEQIELILNEARLNSVHVVHQYLGDQYGYKIMPISPEDKKAELQNAYISAVNDIKQIAKDLKALA